MPGDIPITIPRDPAREAAERELSRPIYHQHDPGLFQRALDWLWEQIGRMLSAASAAAPGGGVGLIAVAVLVVLLVVALRWRLGKVRQAVTSTAGLFDAAPRTAAEHRSTAERLAAEQRWTEAVQERVRALVRSLEERAILDPRPGRTADEAASDAGRALPGHADELADAARTFDDVTYGGRQADQAAYARLRDLDTALQRARPDFAVTSSTRP